MIFKGKRRIVCFIFITFILMITPGCSNSNSGSNTGLDLGKDHTEPAVNAGSGEKNSGIGQKSPDENLVFCPLSGDMVPEGTIDRRPLAVMIENAPAARPQSGLDKADVIYEILAEGGLTRFLAIFLHNDTDHLGPVRSARPYFIERMLEYNAIYAFCGGSEAAFDMIKRQGVASLNEFGVGLKAYWRIKERKAPHNLYTDTVKLRSVGAQRGFEKKVNLPDFVFLSSHEENPDGVDSEETIINYPTKYSLVKWQYDHDKNLYSRFEARTAHRDAVTGKQLTASNIIVQYVKTSVIDNVGRLDLSMVGKGRAIMFTQGKAYEGTWSKVDMRAQTIFYVKNGAIFKFNPGQTWIEVVPTYTKVEY